jgi:lysophospholipase L1-like esterase
MHSSHIVAADRLARDTARRADRRSRRPLRLNPIESALPTPPTISFHGPGGPSPISGARVLPYSTPDVSLLGMAPTLISQYGSSYWRNAINGTGSSPPYAVEFDFYGQVFVLLYRKAATGAESFWLFVDGVPATSLPVAVSGVAGSAGSLYYMKVDFGTTAFRRIRLLCAMADFGGLHVAPTTSVSPSRTRLPKLGWIGDSWGEGTNHLTNTMLPIPQRVAMMLGCEPALNGSQGGTGWMQSGGADWKRAMGDASRIDPMIAAAPDIIVLQGSINDNGLSSSGISAQVTSTIDRLTAALPLADIVAVGVQMIGGAPSAAAITNNDAFFAGVTAAARQDRITAISPMAEGWITGTGRAGAVAGDGNADAFIGSDGIHPTDAGAAYWASRIAARIAAG